ncbi:MAG: hypothetical protein H0T51_15630 [Pirellulales bacterium]|nr:hypothetical protein [Pirellulales bacterium]
MPALTARLDFIASLGADGLPLLPIFQNDHHEYGGYATTVVAAKKDPQASERDTSFGPGRRSNHDAPRLLEVCCFREFRASFECI